MEEVRLPPLGAESQNPAFRDPENDRPDAKGTEANYRDKTAPFPKWIKNACSQTKTTYAQHKGTIKICLRLLFLLFFLAFLGYALWYDFWPAVPLLVITIIGLIGLAWWALEGPVSKKLNPVFTKAEGAVSRLPARTRRWLPWLCGLLLLIALMVFVVVDALSEPERLVSLLGIAVYLLIALACSTDPFKVRWRPVAWGLGLQFLMGLVIIRWEAGSQAFQWLGQRVNTFLSFTNSGTSLVYGFVANIPPICQMQWAPPLAFAILPVIIFFSSVVSVLYYYGIMQWLVQKMASCMQVTLGTSATESLSCAGNIFLGMTESPLLIAPFLPDMTDSEINAVMTGGFATIAGSVFGVYVSFGACANHLLGASVMSAPAALAVAKLIHPETQESKSRRASDLPVNIGQSENNALEAAANGATQAIFLVANICANLIAFLAILAFVNAVLAWLGSLVGLPVELSLELIMSYIFYPLAWLMGVGMDSEELLRVSELMGVKTILNEFIAYQRMGDMLKKGLLSPRAQLVSTYALCGFSNIGSVGVMLGALGGLCPEKRGVMAKCALRALIGGSIACFLTACVAGLLASDVGECAKVAGSSSVCIDLNDVFRLLNATTT